MGVTVCVCVCVCGGGGAMNIRVCVHHWCEQIETCTVCMYVKTINQGNALLTVNTLILIPPSISISLTWWSKPIVLVLRSTTCRSTNNFARHVFPTFASPRKTVLNDCDLFVRVKVVSACTA